MIRRSPIAQEFNFLSEILPITLVAILLNIAGRQLAERLDLLFVDMIGTAFAALLLGPWWAASVAAATTIVNGGFFEIYFPFGVVNIAGALAWGYLGRAVDIRGRVFDGQPGRLPGIVLWTVILWLVGALVCGLASSGVKLILFPQMERPLVLGDYYIKVQMVLASLLGGDLPPVVILIAGDLGRDLHDKAIVVPAAMMFVLVARISPTINAPISAPRMLPSPPITTTANASTTNSTGISSEAAAVGTTSAPPTVPSTVPTVKTLVYIQRTFTPSA